MNRARLLIVTLFAVTLAVVAVATSAGSTKKQPQSAVAPSSAISIKQTSLGKTLVDAKGRTLYLFQGDQPNVSRLSVAGQAVWPPFNANAKPAATGGASAAQIGTIAGVNGRTQVTYNGHPLYYFVGDHNPGQTNGQGLNEFGGLWYALSPGGVAVTSTPTTTAPGTPANSGSSNGGGSAYGY